MTKEFLFVFIGSGFGGLCRYALTLMYLKNTFTTYPWGTLTANILASFIIGILFAYFFNKQQLSSQHYLLLATGFCGGMSTFSAFALESQLMWQQQQYGLVAIYVLVSTMGCIGAVMLGKMIVS
jgi:CrcB protein